MINLYIDNQYVEQFSDETINLTKRVASMESIGSVLSDFTRNFTLPATDSNNEIFSHYYDVSVQNGYNPYVKVNAHIESDTIELFRGVIELLSVAFEDGQPKSYDVVFYGSTKTLSSLYGEDTLADIDWSAYHHVTSEANVASSWTGGLESGVVKYPLFDYHRGVVYGDDNVDVPNNIRIAGRGYGANNLRPALRLKEMVQKCLAHAGYSLSTSISTDLFQDSFTSDIYCLPVAQAGRIMNPDIAQDYEFVAIDPNGEFIQIPYYKKINFDGITSGNAGGGMNVTTDIFTAAHQGQHEFSLEIEVGSFEPTASGVTGSVSYAAFVNGTFKTAILYLLGDQTGTFTEPFTINMFAGDELEIRAFCVTGFTSSSQQLSCTSAPYGIQGETINLASIMPQVKIVDFLQGILTTFNAVIIPDGETAFRISNIDAWYDSGSTIDWTEYVDLKSIVHRKVSIPKRISFSHKACKDMSSVSFADANLREFGSMSFTPDVDFTGPEINIQTPFSIIVPQRLNKINDQYETISVTDLEAPILLDSDLKPAQNELTLFFMPDSEVYSTSNRYYAAGSLRTSFPFAGTFNETAADTDTLSLAFSLESSVLGDVPTNTLYQHFWSRYIARIFAKSARRVSVTAFLPIGTWLNMDLSNTIRIGSYYYKVESIDYNIGSGEAKLNLFIYTPVSVNNPSSSDNEITLQTNYVTPSSENLIFAANVQKKMFHLFNRGGANYVTLAPKNINMPQSLQTRFIADRHSVMNYPRHSHLDRAPANFSVDTTWTTIAPYDSLVALNKTDITANKTDGIYTTTKPCWARIVAKVTWDGNQHIQFAIRQDEVNIKEASVNANAGALTLTEVVFMTTSSQIDVAIRKTTGEPHTYTIGCIFEIEEIA